MLGKTYASFVLLAVLGYTKAFPVLPMHYFLPHHQELDEFGAPIHHNYIYDDDIYNDEVADHDHIHDHDFDPAYDYYMDHEHYDHDHSAPVHDPSVHTDHAYYSHSYGIEPSVNAIELDEHSHQDRHHLAENGHESMFTNSKASHGFDSTMDFMDGIHHDHLHHDHHQDVHHAAHSEHPSSAHYHHAYDGHHDAYDHFYNEHHYPLEHHQGHIGEPHTFDWFHHDVHGAKDVHEAHPAFVKRDLPVSESATGEASHPNAKDDLVHNYLQKNDTSSSTKVALASTLIGA